MAIITYPLNDITYSAEDAELFHCTRTSGVFAADEDFSISVTGSNNNVTIGTGVAWIKNSKFSGKVAANKESYTLAMGTANSSYDRIDAVVLQFSANSNRTTIIKKQGTASSSPVAPAVTQTEDTYELHLYHIRRRAGATAILASDITDLRSNRAYCGVMSDDVTMLGDDYIKEDMIGAANGVAGLDSNKKVLASQIPSLSYIPTSQKGSASGVAPLDANSKVTTAYLPVSNSENSSSTTTVATSYALQKVFKTASTAAQATFENHTDFYVAKSGRIVTCTGSMSPSGFGSGQPLSLSGLSYRPSGATSFQITLLQNDDTTTFVNAYVDFSGTTPEIKGEEILSGKYYNFSFSYVTGI